MPTPAGPDDLPAWTPTLAQVAAYVPRRTLVGAVDGWGATQHTFTADTTPSSSEVLKLITDAVQWVGLAAGTVIDALAESATSAAAMRCAGYVELTYPDNRDDLGDAKTLLDQATALRKDLAAANIALTADDPSTDADNQLPQWSFPAAPDYGDCVF